MDKKEKEMLDIFDKKNGGSASFSNIESKIEYKESNTVRLINIYTLRVIPAVVLASALIAITVVILNKPSSRLLDGKYVITSTSRPNAGSRQDGYMVPTWEQKTKLEQFPSLIYNSKHYRVNSTLYTVPLDEKYIDSKLGTATAKGYDIYENKNYEEEVECYSIKKIDSDLALAIKYDGLDEYYCMRHVEFEMSTLGDLIDSTNLEEYVSFGDLSFEYLDKNEDFYEINYSDISHDEIYNCFFSDKAIPLTYGDAIWNAKRLYTISINEEALGVENLSLTVYDNGIVETNLLGVGKWWDIGSTKAKSFLDDIERKYQGYAIKY